MSQQEINESPGRGTNGLTSAQQIIDVTDSVSFSVTNTTSALFESVAPIVVKEKIERSFEELEPLASRGPRFSGALRESIRRNRDIIRELSRF